MKEKREAIIFAVIAFLGVHLLLFVLLNQIDFVFLPTLDQAGIREGIIFLILLSSSVLWGYTCYIMLFICRLTQKVKADKILILQLPIWVLVALVISALIYAAGYGEYPAVTMQQPLCMMVCFTDYFICWIISKKLLRAFCNDV